MPRTVACDGGQRYAMLFYTSWVSLDAKLPEPPVDSSLQDLSVQRSDIEDMHAKELDVSRHIAHVHGRTRVQAQARGRPRTCTAHSCMHSSSLSKLYCEVAWGGELVPAAVIRTADSYDARQSSDDDDDEA